MARHVLYTLGCFALALTVSHAAFSDEQASLPSRLFPPPVPAVPASPEPRPVFALPETKAANSNPQSTPATPARPADQWDAAWTAQPPRSEAEPAAPPAEDIAENWMPLQSLPRPLNPAPRDAPDELLLRQRRKHQLLQQLRVQARTLAEALQNGCPPSTLPAADNSESTATRLNGTSPQRGDNDNAATPTQNEAAVSPPSLQDENDPTTLRSSDNAQQTTGDTSNAAQFPEESPATPSATAMQSQPTVDVSADETRLSDSPSTDTLVTGAVHGPIDRVALASSLYATAQYAECLAILKEVPMDEIDAESVDWVKYLKACCYRQQGQYSEAEAVYRELLDKRHTPWITQAAVWWLAHLSERRDLEKRIADVRTTTQAWKAEIDALKQSE